MSSQEQTHAHRGTDPGAPDGSSAGRAADCDPVATTVSRRASVGFVVVRGSAVVWANSAAQALVADYRGDWLDPDDATLLDVLRRVPAGRQCSDMRWIAACGATRWWDVTCRALDTAPGADELLYEIVDATARQERLTRARSGEWRLARLETLARMGTWEWNLTDDSVEWSNALVRLFGYPDGHSLDYGDYRSLLHPDDVPMIERTLADALRTGSPFTYTHRMYLADRATLRVFECYGEVITDAAGAPLRVIGTARDITEHHQARQELAFLAGHDPLTGLANRRGITERLASCAVGSAGGALLLIDIDNFKDINDLRGHAVGDQVMRAIAQRLTAALDPQALLGRLGGDEFAVVLPGADPATAVDLAERLCDTIAATPVVHQDHVLRVTTSIGVAPIAPRSDVEGALAYADLALYEAKNSGRNRARLFTPTQYRQAARRVSVVQRLADALDAGTLRLHAQPIVPLTPEPALADRGRAEPRYELLVRLCDGQAPELQPAQFLAAAERSDLVLRLDRWVIEQAVRALATPAARRCGLQLEVNLSARSVDDPDLASWILTTLHDAGVPADRIGIEITETAALTSLDAARELAATLTGAGCGFALDDFGAGFGSFAHLKHLPFTAVKIAGEFVRHVDGDGVDRALVDAVVRVAHELGMSTVAEHIDRAPLVTTLRDLGVDYGQGFHLGRPRPLDELLSVVQPLIGPPRTTTLDG